MHLAISRFACLLLLACALPVHAAEPAYRVTHQEVLPGAVRWDYLTYDAGSGRLFITRGDHVDVYDTKLGRAVGSIAHTPGVHGVALAPGLNRGFTSNGGGNTVTVFELSSLKVRAALPTGKNPTRLSTTRSPGVFLRQTANRAR